MWTKEKRRMTNDEQNKSKRLKKMKKGRGRKDKTERKIIRIEEKECKTIEKLMKGDKVD
jgi:hypothetical protein